MWYFLVIFNTKIIKNTKFIITIITDTSWGRGNLGNARKKSIFLAEVFPYSTINSGIFLTNDRSPTFSQVVQVSGLGRGLPKTAEAANRPKSLLRWWHAQLWQLSRGRMEERGAHHGKATCNVFRLLMTRRLQCYLLNHMWLLTIACTIPAVTWRWRRNRDYPAHQIKSFVKLAENFLFLLRGLTPAK